MSACYCGVPYENIVDHCSLYNNLALRLAALLCSHIRLLDPCSSLCDSHSSFNCRASVERKRNGPTRSSYDLQINCNRALLRYCVGVLGRSVLSIHVLANVEYQRSYYNCSRIPYSHELGPQTSFGQVSGSYELIKYPIATTAISPTGISFSSILGGNVRVFHALKAKE